ncbi:hypothetical protein R1flu_025691 [Riccia fluitans]|uniref:Ribosomal protein S15 n=1 Tax=Riccia fluitans TaxID=41844 RepID=A0ABD1XYH2_9MARC
MEQYHTDEGLLAEVQGEATRGDKLQKDLHKVKWQLKPMRPNYRYSKRRNIARWLKLHAQGCSFAPPSIAAYLSSPPRWECPDSERLVL